MDRRKENEKVMGIEPCNIEVEAEEAGMPVAEFFVKELNALQNPEYEQATVGEVVAKVDTDGYEYRVTITLPEDEIMDDEIYPLLKIRARFGASMWIAIGPNRHLQAIYIWTRPTKNARIGDEPNLGR